MEAEKAKQLVTDLDEIIPKENSHIGIYRYADTKDDCGCTEGFLQGSRNGYLRLGVEILKGTLASEAKAAEINLNIENLFHEDSDVLLQYFKLSNDKGSNEYVETFNEKALAVGVMILLALILILSIVGAISVVRYLIN